MLAAEQQKLFDRFLLLTGRLNYSWTNTESLLIHVIAGLVGTDKETATVIFLSLNTTRARIDLTERLAKMDGRSPCQRDGILDCTRAMGQFSAIRNRFNHCIYSFDAERGSPQTILMRIADRKHDIRMGRNDPIDLQELERIAQINRDLAELNRKIWRLIERERFPV
ncbi:hypothetical protein JSE7799_02804 [Jannaschia seosinensis]|uniref:Uncharacterized protein n=1 Tax=Jannaschia seosinensis TaxID=313367 RepID=A0A0M7BFD2_9RHOB|nr:hypothetical protein [Jannaschia seosinensis]CUH40075.1 hypothetical protein JSE7799_02804 [Jannaschia seosinensis]